MRSASPLSRNRHSDALYSQTSMTTAEEIKGRLELQAEIADLREVVQIAVLAAVELLKIGKPEIRTRQNLLTWGQLSTTIELLKKEFQIEEIK
jgi:hypothetical protein